MVVADMRKNLQTWQGQGAPAHSQLSSRRGQKDRPIQNVRLIVTYGEINYSHMLVKTLDVNYLDIKRRSSRLLFSYYIVVVY
jgi:hypothetical protein